MVAREEYRVDNPAIKALLRSIADKVGGACPAGWGFLLMLFEYGTPEDPGANFYISSAERDGVVRMVQEWLRQQRTVSDEINPTHPLTQQLHHQWHKVAALLLMKLAAGGRVVFTAEDVNKLADADVSVAAKDEPDGLHIWLVDTAEARQLAVDGKAEEGKP